MALELLCTVLACSEAGFLEANPHKVLAATVGFSLLTAAFFVRRHRSVPRRPGHAFEVLIGPEAQPPIAEEARRPGR